MKVRLSSYVLLGVSFLCWVYVLMFFTGDTSYGQIYMILAALNGVWTAVVSTILSPRRVGYDLIRYFMLACLAWIAAHISLAVLGGIVVLSLLLLPSVVADFKGTGAERQERIIERAFGSYAKKQTDGIMFEHQCAEYLRKMGYRNIHMTKTTGDFGADLTAYDKYGVKWVFQCKRYSGNVGIAAVQQAVAAKAHYGASRGGVMTNSNMTAAAKQLAWENAIEIIEGLSD